MARTSWPVPTTIGSLHQGGKRGPGHTLPSTEAEPGQTNSYTDFRATRRRRYSVALHPLAILRLRSAGTEPPTTPFWPSKYRGHLRSRDPSSYPGQMMVGPRFPRPPSSPSGPARSSTTSPTSPSTGPLEPSVEEYTLAGQGSLQPQEASWNLSPSTEEDHSPPL